MPGIGKLYGFITSVATQIRAAMYVGVPVEDDTTARLADFGGPTFGPPAAELWDDTPGRVMPNGFGSLEISAGTERADE